MHILIVKTSSLGDVIHTLPALTDAARRRSGLRVDWVVEQPFAEIPAWHPAVDHVIPCDLRGWRKRPLHALLGGEWARFRARLHERRYDCVIDAQGLIKSAWLARRAGVPVSGPNAASARERLAALFYRHRYPLPRHDAAHAVERSRRLFAQALDYPLPNLDKPSAGLDPARFPQPGADFPYAVFLHGSSWASKRWPPGHWQTLGAWLQQRYGLRAVLPWGTAAERSEAEAIAGHCNGLVLPALRLAELGGWLAQARIVVGVDTGLMHFAAALGTPGLSLYGPTLPALTGAVGRNQVWLQDDEHARTIDRRRALKMTPERVQTALAALL